MDTGVYFESSLEGIDFDSRIISLSDKCKAPFNLFPTRTNTIRSDGGDNDAPSAVAGQNRRRHPATAPPREFTCPWSMVIKVIRRKGASRRDQRFEN